MTEIKQFFTGAAAELIPRDRWGRPQIKQPDGKLKAYQRVTTFVGPLEDTSNLTKWKMRQVLRGVMSRPALQMAVSSAADDDRQLNKIAEDCLDASGSSDKATLGTALHKFTENHDNGLDISAMPAAFKPDLAAYVQATANMKMVAIEQFVVIDELAVAGTTDRIVEINGRYYIADVKTGSIDYGAGKMCMQLATYSHGKGYNPETGERIDLPPVSQTAGIIIHLPSGTGTCELFWCDLVAGWDAAKNLAVGVQAWRKRKPAELLAPFAKAVPETPAPSPAELAVILDDANQAKQAAGAAVAAARPVHNFPGNQNGMNKLAGEVDAALTQAIVGAIDVATLNTLWDLNKTVWEPHHSKAAGARKKELEGGTK